MSSEICRGNGNGFCLLQRRGKRGMRLIGIPSLAYTLTDIYPPDSEKWCCVPFSLSSPGNMDGIYSYKRFIDPKSTDFKQNFILGYVRAQSELTFQTKPSGPSLVNGSGDAEDGVLPPIEVQNETGQTIVMGSYVDDIEVNSSATQIKPEGKKKMLDGMVQTDLASSKRTKASHLSRRKEYLKHHKAKSQAEIQSKTIKYDFDDDTSFLKPEPPTVIDSSSDNEKSNDNASQKKQPMKAGKSTVRQVSTVPDPSPEAPSLSKIRDAVRQQRADTKRARASIQKKAEPAKEAKKSQKSKKSNAAGKSGSVEIMTKFLSDKIGSSRVTVFISLKVCFMVPLPTFLLYPQIKPALGIYNKGKRSEKIQVSEGPRFKLLAT
ncbi:hypothetical protein BKA69DRAFT_879691 [Paraphysoderma sedebokerense]|nr:hypothetical protein BKA69DRAFT_879691 [Paraphysoderma sedebokerense]